MIYTKKQPKTTIKVGETLKIYLLQRHLTSLPSAKGNAGPSKYDPRHLSRGLEQLKKMGGKVNVPIHSPLYLTSLLSIQVKLLSSTGQSKTQGDMKNKKVF